MRRLLLVLVLPALLVAMTFAGSGFAQDIPPDQGGGPETGCEGIRNAEDAQDESTIPEENSEVAAVGDAHLCKLDIPSENPYAPGSSGGHPQGQVP
jgi:hypothetical protein